MIVPVYNTRIEYFRQCICSILNQTYIEFELIIVNDGSSNGVENVCDEYHAMDSRVQVMHQANKGKGAARNTGAAAAQGDYIVFIDSDDWIEPNTFERFDAVNPNNEYDYVAHGAVRNYNGLETLPTYISESRVYEGDDICYLQKMAFQPRNTKGDYVIAFAGACCKFYKTAVIRQFGLRQDKGLLWGEDVVFYQSFLNHAKKVYYIAEPLYHYRAYAASACNKYVPDAFEDFRKFTVACEQIMRDGGTTETLRHAYYARIRFQNISMLQSSVFHEDNKSTYFQKRRLMNKIMNTEPVKSAYKTEFLNDESGLQKRKHQLVKLGLFYTEYQVVRIINSLSKKKLYV